MDRSTSPERWHLDTVGGHGPGAKAGANSSVKHGSVFRLTYILSGKPGSFFVDLWIDPHGRH